jgi:hypothetical protein
MPAKEPGRLGCAAKRAEAAQAITPNVPINDSGKVTAGISVAHSLRRNRKMTSTTRAIALSPLGLLPLPGQRPYSRRAAEKKMNFRRWIPLSRRETFRRPMSRRQAKNQVRSPLSPVWLIGP